MTEKAIERNNKYFPSVWAVLVSINREEYLSSDELLYGDFYRLYGFIECLAAAYGNFGDNYISCIAELQRYEEFNYAGYFDEGSDRDFGRYDTEVMNGDGYYNSFGHYISFHNYDD